MAESMTFIADRDGKRKIKQAERKGVGVKDLEAEIENA